MKKFALALSVLAAFSTTAMAEGDAAAGQSKAAMCVACHGADGNSMIDMYPKLASQHAKYLEKQLHDFQNAMKTAGKDGRMDPIMGSMVMTLNDKDMADLAAFYASQKQTPTAVADVPALGKQLYVGGDTARGITACAACHGPEGKGNEQAGFPMLAGQHTNYIKSQLTKFHAKARSNDLNGMMQDVAAKLTPADIDAVSAYVASLK